MERALRYLEENSSITGNDIVSINLENLTTLIKIVQLETMIEFLVMNYPEELGLLHTLQFELKNLIKIEDKKQELSTDDGISC